ncbi:amino acid ABC transporter permease [Calderihabitans maritimus]|uniref:Glutamine ABC transporter permease n=1 Tax=Calderihabitans maritimus TaxID=1246530 RepID=A0A1Z5HUY9_9FIRM|nr:amino acid ABC transporter permease [Calderihabitans maritimus]GAW93151.1 glutamine ABC transporter permease [Calderihabitans maritimus]
MKWGFMIEILPILFEGAKMTVGLTVISITIGSIIGLFVSLARLSKFKLLSKLAGAYVDFFRGTPLLVQIMLIHYGLPQLLGYTPVKLVSGIVALSINSGAYVAEIFRAGIQSIDRGQMEAARSLGMTYGQAMRYVILPQAFKVCIPPLGNEFIALLKDSSLVMVIGLHELMTKGKLIVGRRPRPFEVYITIAFIYLLMTMSISYLVSWAERRLRTGDQS